MKKHIFLFISTVYFNNAYPQVTCTGTVYNSPKPKVWLTNFFNKKIDSADINPEIPTFTLNADISKETLLIIRYEKKSPYKLNEFIVMPGEHVVFSFDAASQDKYLWINVHGSSFTLERITAYKNELPYKLEIENISKKIAFIRKNAGRDTSTVAPLSAQINQAEEHIDLIAKKLLDTTRSPQNAGLMFTSLKYSFLNSDEMKDSLLAVLKGRFPNNKNIQSLKSSIGVDDDELPVNAKAPNITLKDIDGIQVDANKTDYKYLLIDFWASWCEPCREESPYLIKTFDTFRAKGFKILSISIDADSDKWKDAIKADGTLKFIQLRDPNAYKSIYLKEYKINGIPTNFLIDRKGSIIAKNMRGDNLYKEVSKLMAAK